MMLVYNVANKIQLMSRNTNPRIAGNGITKLKRDYLKQNGF